MAGILAMSYKLRVVEAVINAYYFSTAIINSGPRMQQHLMFTKNRLRRISIHAMITQEPTATTTLYWRRADGIEECRLLGYKTPVSISQEAHYVSATEPSQLMLSKISGFHGSDYDDCRLLGYKKPVRISQETHNVSATDPRRLMLRKI
jgi:hypothetical protein